MRFLRSEDKGAAGMIAERMATLDGVLEQNADLRLQLEANEEVQRLLN